MRRGLLGFIALVTGSCMQLGACPSAPGGPCDPRNANCPAGYTCALAEICTRPCAEARDCWTVASSGCRGNELPFQQLSDGGTYLETAGDGFCPESKTLVCLDGYCQPGRCAEGGCDYDLYAPSAFKGNRTQGPPK